MVQFSKYDHFTNYFYYARSGGIAQWLEPLCSTQAARVQFPVLSTVCCDPLWNARGLWRILVTLRRGGDWTRNRITCLDAWVTSGGYLIWGRPVVLRKSLKNDTWKSVRGYSSMLPLRDLNKPPIVQPAARAYLERIGIEHRVSNSWSLCSITGT